MTYLNSLIERATINLFSRSVTEKKKKKSSVQPFQTLNTNLHIHARTNYKLHTNNTDRI